MKKTIITAKLLQEKGLQEYCVWTFNHYWPDGLLVSENAILEMSEKDIDITEVAKALFAEIAFKTYEELIESVKTMHDEKMALANQAYDKALEPADKIFDEAIDRLDSKCDSAIEAAEKIFKEMVSVAKKNQEHKIYRAILTKAQEVYDEAIGKSADIYDVATDSLEEDYNKILGPVDQTLREQTIEIIRLYDRTKAIAFIKSWALKK